MKEGKRTSPSDERRSRVGWAMYDWAVSPFSTLIVTFVFATYFQQAVVRDPVRGQALWSLALTLAGIIFATAAPLLGSAADARGRLKPWIAASTLACAVACAGLWFIRPEPELAGMAIVLVVVASIAAEGGAMFANALLPFITARSSVGRLSGWAWGLGYAGGLVALLLVLFVLVQPPKAPFGLDCEAAEHIRLVGPLVGVWLLLFSLPLFLFTLDRRGAAPTAWPPAKVVRRIRALTGQPLLLRFLLANLLYNNGVLTLFAVGGVFAAGVFRLTMTEVLTFGIVLNVAAGLGAFLSGLVDDRIGSKRTIAVSLLGLILSAGIAVVAADRAGLWVAGVGIGLCVGPIQASSRALMARLTPSEEAGGHFGLFALSGRLTAFLGTMAVGTATQLSGSQRWGVATILLFLLAGLALLLTVRSPPQER